MEPILEISHLSITFTQYERGIHKRELPVIKDLSLQIEPGRLSPQWEQADPEKVCCPTVLWASCLITAG